MTPLPWLETFLPRLRCPHSHEPLRRATEQECRQAQLNPGQQALINQSATYLYPVVEGIPHLLPGAGIRLA